MAILQPRWYQEEAVNALFNYLANTGGIGEDGLPIKANPLVALPTGTGKSLVIAGFIWVAMVVRRMFNLRVVVATHDKRLIAQNAKTLLKLWPTAPVGIVSAGLKKRERNAQIIFGGIKSLVNKLVDDNGNPQWVDVLIVDEAHMINNKAEGQYCQFILDCLKTNPNLRVIGLTATWFRLGQGTLTQGQIFSDICYNLCDIQGFARLMAEGFLSPLITPSDPARKINIDLSTVGIGSDGDFRQGALQNATDRPDINFAALREIVHYGANRRSWMIFAAGVEHVEHLAQMLSGAFGVPCVGVHSKMPDAEVDAAFAAFQRGEVRALINKDMATTGFDHPPVDLIGDLGATCSAAKHVQKNGRATRPYDCRNPDQYIPNFEFIKENAIVLDFVGNIERCGPINDPIIPRAPGEKKGKGDAPIKICNRDSLVAPQIGCGNYNHTSARYCAVCGCEFDIRSNIQQHASTAEIIKSSEEEVPQVEIVLVDRVVYTRHVTKATKRALASEGRSWTHDDYFIIKASYYCGLKTYYEYITVESPEGTREQNYARKQGRDWFRARYQGEPPETNEEVLQYSSYLRSPKAIRVWVNKKPYPEIKGAEF
ncbi:DNA helicase [Sphingomonas phage Birtae]|nr:DNA helicase [Sphingomonas phage Birtae]